MPLPQDIRGPHQYKRAVKVAACRIMGMTMLDASVFVGVAVRTVERWEKTEWWIYALADAEDLYHSELLGLARKAVREAVTEGNADLAFKIMERRDPMYSAKQKIELSGPNGGPIELRPRREQLEEAKSKPAAEKALEFKRLIGGEE